MGQLWAVAKTLVISQPTLKIGEEAAAQPAFNMFGL